MFGGGEWKTRWMHAGRSPGYVRQSNAENETQQQLLLRLQLKMPNHRHRHQKDPHVRYQIRNIGKIRELHKMETFALDVDIPKGFDGAADQTESDGYADAPGNDEGGGCEYDFAEEGNDEDAVVEGEDAEFDADEGDVVKVAIDVVAFPDHHQVLWRNDDDMSAHAVGRAWTMLALPVLFVISEWTNTISQTTRALSDETYLCRE